MIRAVVVLALVALASAGPSPAPPVAQKAATEVAGGSANPVGPNSMIPLQQQVMNVQPPIGTLDLMDSPTTGDIGCGPNCNARAVWLQCAINVQIGAATDAVVGTEQWWAENLKFLESFFGQCTSSARNTIRVEGVGPFNDFFLPRAEPVSLQISPNKIAYAFLPFMASEVDNLPSPTARFSAVLTCHKTFSDIQIALKSCVVVNTNKVSPAEPMK